MWIPGIIVNVHDDDGALDIDLNDGSQDFGVSRLFVAHRRKSEHPSPPDMQKPRAQTFVFDLVTNRIAPEQIDAIEWDCAIIAEIDKTKQTRVDVPSKWFLGVRSNGQCRYKITGGCIRKNNGSLTCHIVKKVTIRLTRMAMLPRSCTWMQKVLATNKRLYFRKSTIVVNRGLQNPRHSNKLFIKLFVSSNVKISHWI